jgi:dipeptidyl aminopeptidase/acylaminoacyl peptidase
MAPRWVRAESLRHFLWVKEQEGIETGLGALDVTQLDDGLLLAAVGLTEEQDRPTLSIFLVTPDAAIPIPPVFLPSRGTYEEWSLAPNPRTEFLAFETNDGADREIYMFTKHGPANLTNHRAADWNPVWDPTGKWMLFESYRGGRRGVYRNYPDTRRIRPLAVSPVYDNWAPCWSPDGQSVVFVSNRGGNPDLFLIDREGENLRQLTDHAADDLAPAWRPEARE